MATLVLEGDAKSNIYVEAALAAAVYSGVSVKHSQSVRPALKTSEGDITGASAIARYVARLSPDSDLYGDTNCISEARVDQWLDFAANEVIGKDKDHVGKAVAALNSHLLHNTFLASENLTIADMVVYLALRSSLSQHTSSKNFSRWATTVSNHKALTAKAKGASPALRGNAGPSANKKSSTPAGFVPVGHTAYSWSGAGSSRKEAGVPPSHVAYTWGTGGATPNQGKKQKGKKGGDQKQQQQQQDKGKGKGKGGNAKGGKAAAAADVPDLARLDIRVGFINKAWKHPDSDKLWCEEINVGEDAPRSIASGLQAFVPLDKMQQRLCVVLCNLKARALGGFPSHGMVMCATSKDGKTVELLDPPQGAKPGERITFEGYEGEADAQLNPKKKIFEKVQPDFVTSDGLVATYKGVAFMTSAGPVKVASVKGGSIS